MLVRGMGTRHSARASAATIVAVALVAVMSTMGWAAGPPKGTPKGVSGAHQAVCGSPAAGAARCHAEVITKADGATPAATSSPSSGALDPADLQSAYRLPSATDGNGKTVAIVDAYNNPNAESDLAIYRSQWGLPPCGSGDGCFRKVNQSGATTPLPSDDVGWGQEIAIDIQMVSAACPNCKILLVETNSNSYSDLLAGVDRAVLMSADAISNSYGGREFSGETTYESHFNKPVAITVSSGDSGYQREYPAASKYVTAVGGTTLNSAGSARGWSETAVSGAGSGC